MNALFKHFPCVYIAGNIGGFQLGARNHCYIDVNKQVEK